MYSKGAFYLSFEVLNEKYRTLYYIFNLSLALYHINSVLVFFNFQKDWQSVIGCDGILKYPEISGQFLTHRLQMITRWCTSLADGIFLVQLQGDSLTSMLRTFQHLCARLPVCPFLRTLRLSIQLFSSLSFNRSSSLKIWFFFVCVTYWAFILLKRQLCNFPALNKKQNKT